MPVEWQLMPEDSVLVTPDSLLATFPYAPVYKIYSSRTDTIPPEEDEEREKLNKKEQVSFAMVMVGTILMMIGFGLAIFVLINILQGASIATTIWYFIGAIVLIGFLLREWGVLMKT